MLGMISYSDPAHRREKSRLQQERDSVCFTTFIHRVREGGGIPPIQGGASERAMRAILEKEEKRRGSKSCLKRGQAGKNLDKKGAGEGPTGRQEELLDGAYRGINIFAR